MKELRTRARRPPARPAERAREPALDAVAIDWSGAARGAERKLWLAHARAGRLLRLECGRSRDASIDHVVELARDRPRLALGLDFAFSFPAWFVRALGARSAPELWTLVAERAEAWLAECAAPFWGRRGRRRPPPTPAATPWRRTESEHPPLAGVTPKSVFQIGGAGSVGVGSLRGMPYLARLRAAGFAIWPFDAPRLPLVVEIYPRYLTGAVTKTDPNARRLYLDRELADQDPALVERAVRSDDAFDAAVSALRMSRHESDLRRPERARVDEEELEGRIWCPRGLAPTAFSRGSSSG